MIFNQELIINAEQYKACPTCLLSGDGHCMPLQPYMVEALFAACGLPAISLIV